MLKTGGRPASKPARRRFVLTLVTFLAATLAGVSCNKQLGDNTIVVVIESSPTNLDPRIGTDAQSERIDELLFDPLVHRDDQFNIRPAVATSWENPDPQTYVFHLRTDVRFHDGRRLSARDVKWTLDSLRDGTVVSAKSSTYKLVDKVEAIDDATLLIHLRERNATLLWNLSDGAFGIVPYGSGKDFNRHPVGSGPFRFVQLDPDSQVLIERNEGYWSDLPKIAHVRFAVVPDTTTRALELRKGSADVAAPNSLTADVISTLKKESHLTVLNEPGTSLVYLAFNLRDPILSKVQVRQALAYAIDRQPIVHYLFGDAARLADSVLPPQHWAYSAAPIHYEYDPAKAEALLDAAGYKRDKKGVRFHLTMKTSTEETTRLLAAVLQQQLRKTGIVLDIRSFEFATFYADVVHGAFQVYSLRWVGGSNQDPDIFENVFDSASFAPKRANRGYYSNPQVDALIAEGRSTLDQQRRKAIYEQIQGILAHDLPYIDFWYLNNVMVHSRRVLAPKIGPSGNYDFLTTASLAHSAP